MKDVFDKKEEKNRVDQWLNKLNVYYPGYIYGDIESQDLKTVDFVNHDQKIAIELKREKGENLDNKNGNTLILSNRIEKYINDSNKKFREYFGYKTILIIELKSSIFSVQVIMSGVITMHFANGEYIGNTTKNERLFRKMENIGAIVFWLSPENISNRAHYFNNETAKKDFKLRQEEVEKIIGNKLENLELI